VLTPPPFEIELFVPFVAAFKNKDCMKRAIPLVINENIFSEC